MAGADAVAAAQDDLQSAEAGLTNAQEIQLRNVILSHEGYASDQTFDASTAALTAAQAKGDAARAAVEPTQSIQAADNADVAQAKAELDLAKWRLGDTAYVNTPLIGIVAEARASDYYLIQVQLSSSFKSCATGTASA